MTREEKENVIKAWGADVKHIGWIRIGWYYVMISIYPGDMHWRIRKYGFITYHLIRLIHGQLALERLGRE